MTGRWSRRMRSAMWSVCSLALSLPCSGWFSAPPAAAQAAVTSAEADWRQDLDAWRARREKEIDAPEGILTLAGLVWLKPGANSLGAAPDNAIQLHAQVPAHLGLLIVSGNTVQLMATVDGFSPDLLVDGKPAQEGPLATGPKPSIVAFRGLSLAVLDRGGRFVLRIKDADSPARAAFHGLNWFAPDPNLSIQASWTPFTPSQTLAIPTVLGTTINLPSPGIAAFTLGDRKFTLQPVLENSASKTLFFILSDLTLKTSTYIGGRVLYAPFPDHGLDKPGNLILDFNRIENPPCAYTTFATCPLPPEHNRLPIAIEAGEKRYTP